MPTIQITHTPATGTRLTQDPDTQDTDSQATALLHHHGWKWSHHTTTWYLPRSRARALDEVRVQATAAGLRSLGFEVHLEPGACSVAELEEDLSNRGHARAAALNAQADKVAAREQLLDDQLHQLRDRMPFGQPVLAGTAGARSVQRHYDQVVDLSERSIQAHRQVKELRQAAAAAASHARARSGPTTVANRIKRLTADLRKAPEDPALLEQLEYWTAVREEQICSGRTPALGPDQIAAGDHIRLGNDWYTVAKANTQSVTVEGQTGRSRRVPYTSINDHMKMGDQDE